MSEGDQPVKSLRKDASPLKIIRAKPDMAEALTSIAFDAKRHWDYPERWIELWTPLLTITPEFIQMHDTFMVELDGAAVGFYALSFSAERASLEHLWVLPRAMGRGVGAGLFCHALERCRAAGARVLEIESDPHAQGFYERLGAHKVGEARADVDGLPRSLPVLEIKITGTTWLFLCLTRTFPEGSN